ncbi:hypothetical protein NUU61_006980 [Penicillium alfredii]|uniref:Large ribosomal subunit protein mL50 n=1 Tax=Penicillium alfredii TaxID=1506179 RepID=A0A9W9F272_9EURO|nr:uncharacterized protein NUU61_006980 [Penicillium alfredii]KAJ5092110.1 hypothetical protein NUU61_006980 [Penicillium alfredii]
MRPSVLRGALYVCSACRQEATPQRISPLARQFRRYASDAPPSLLERTRRKLWGTDQPPGAKDPYTGESQIAQPLRSGVPEESKPEADGLASPDEEAQPDELASADTYEQATTWHGLETIGYLEETEWLREGSNEKDEYVPYAANIKHQNPTDAAHQAAVELCLLRMLKKQHLTTICDISQHHRKIRSMIRQCRVDGSPGCQWENALRFPDQRTMDVLIFVFMQIAPGARGEKWLRRMGRSAPFIMDKKSPITDGFRSLPLTDFNTKFAFMKRFGQLMGSRIPDSNITSSSTIGQSINALSSIPSAGKQRTARKVREKLGKNAAVKLPNVKIYPKRHTRADNDRDFGRQKAIVAALYNQGLMPQKGQENLLPPRIS